MITRDVLRDYLSFKFGYHGTNYLIVNKCARMDTPLFLVS